MKAKFTFEVTSDKKEILPQIFENIEKNIKEFKYIKILSEEKGEPLEREIQDPNNPNVKIKIYTAYINILAELEEFDHLLDFILWYAPSRVEVEDIKEIKIITKEKEIKYNKEKVNILLSQISKRIIDISILLSTIMVQNRILGERLKKYEPDAVKPIEFKLNLPTKEKDQPK